MSITAKVFRLSKQFKLHQAKGKLLSAFHRSHAYIEMIYDGKKEKNFNHYKCFNKFEDELSTWLNKNCKGLWSSEGETLPLTNGTQSSKHYNGNLKDDPDGGLLKLHLYFEEPDDLSLFIKEKALLLKLSAE